MNTVWMVPYNVIMEKKSKMSATAADSLTWDSIGKTFSNLLFFKTTEPFDIILFIRSDSPLHNVFFSNYFCDWKSIMDVEVTV